MCILYTVYGAALLDHVLLGAGFDEGALIGDITGKQCEPSVATNVTGFDISSQLYTISHHMCVLTIQVLLL